MRRPNNFDSLQVSLKKAVKLMHLAASSRDICETFIPQKVWKSSENTGAYIDSRHI